MKIRFISFLLILLLLPTMVVPASAAASSSDGIIELLDYDYFNNWDNLNSFHFNGTSPVYTIDVPLTGTYYYVDMVMTFNDDSVDFPLLNYSYSDQWSSFSGSIPGELVGKDTVRYSGAIRAYEYPEISFQFVSSISSETTYCNVQSCRIFKALPLSTPLDSGMTGSWNETTFDIISLASGDRGFSMFYDDYSDPNAGHNFEGLTVVSNALDYDYIDIIFRFTIASVKSVSCYFHNSGTSIPIEVNYLNGSNDSTITFVQCRLDLTGVNKALVGDDYPVIDITGETGFGYNVVRIDSCTGIVVAAGENPDLHWYTKVLTALSNLGSNISSWISTQTTAIGNFFSTNFNNLSSWIYNMQSSITGWLSDVRDSIVIWGQNIVSAINPSPDAGQDAADQGAQQGSTITDLNDQMNNLNKPALEGSGDISGIITPGQLTSYTTVLATVVNAPYISQVVMLSLILSLAAYVLFGKR